MTHAAWRSLLHRPLSALLVLSLLLVALPDPVRAAPDEIVFRSSAVSTTGNTITAPSDIETGDILVLADRADNTSSTPSTQIPSGFTVLQNDTQTNRRQILSYKLADGSEASATLTGMSAQFAVRKVLLVFRGSRVITSLVAAGAVGTMTDADPSAQNVAASGGAFPLVVVAAFGSTGYASGNEIATPTLDALVAATDRLGLGYKIYNATPANVSIDLGDLGTANSVQGAYIEAVLSPPLAPDAPTNLITTSITGGVSLSWTAPASSGSSNLETYGIWRHTSPFTSTTAALIASFATSTGTSYSDTSAMHGIVYYYRVTATNSAATSSLSNQKSSGSNSGRIIRLGGLRLR